MKRDRRNQYGPDRNAQKAGKDAGFNYTVQKHAHIFREDVPVVEVMYFVLVTRMSCKSYRRRLTSLLCLCDVFRELINSIVC